METRNADHQSAIEEEAARISELEAKLSAAQEKLRKLEKKKRRKAASSNRTISAASSIRNPAESALKGEGGMINNAPADAALERRGNLGLRQDLKDQRRIYDPVQESNWHSIFRFHSDNHMRKKFRTFAHARHDPFNKDPAWGKALLGEIAKACEGMGLDPQDLFKGVDLTGDGSLNRPEMKKVILKVFPALSDSELAAVFDTIDKDQDGEVDVHEFVRALKTRVMDKKASHSILERNRNPIHRTKRFAPARVEGWDHLEWDSTEPLQDKVPMVKLRQDQLFLRLGGELMERPRALKLVEPTVKYSNFGGGGSDGSRFRRHVWHRDRGTCLDTRLSAAVQVKPVFGDPGPDARPGFMCDPQGQDVLRANGWSCTVAHMPKPVIDGPPLG